MTEELGVQTVSDSVMSIEQSRAIQEVQASLVIAKRFPRDQDAAYVRIMKACERFSLADQAEYAYPRGGKTVEGPSIRLAEVIAQNWGNMKYGIRELSQSAGESDVEAFAWDLETNVEETKTFTVKHMRYSKAKGNVGLSDPRDIYEIAANQGARRMRACILGVIPGDITEDAQKKCRETVRKGIKEKPMKDQIRATLKAFDSLGITKDLIEKRLGHGTETIIEDELIELNNIGRSIKDNMTTREEWFDVKGGQQKKADDLTNKIKPNYAAQDLKAKLDAGDTEIDGYSSMKDKEPEQTDQAKLQAAQAKLEEKREQLGQQNGEDNQDDKLPEDHPLYQLSICRPGSSIAANKDVISDYEKNDSEVAMLANRKLRDRIDAKYKKAKDLIAKQPPTLNHQVPAVISPERKAFEDKMKSYMAQDERDRETRYHDKLKDLGFASMADVKTLKDQEVVLGFMAEEFGE